MKINGVEHTIMRTWIWTLHCLCGLGSNGASVMLSRRSGVSKILTDKVP